MSNDLAEHITLILPGVAQPGQASIHPDENGPLLPHNAAGVAGQAVALDAGLIRANIDKCLTEVEQVFDHLKQPSIDGWSVNTITVGLSITAQGSIGIATAGVEASLQITFTPNK